MYSDGRESKSVKQLKYRKQKNKEFIAGVVQGMMWNVRTKLQHAEEGGPFTIL